MKRKVFTSLIVMARKQHKLSQLEACELIGISDRTLSRYENEINIPSEEVVIKMIQVYENPLIGYLYLKECTEIGEFLLPEIRSDPWNLLLDENIQKKKPLQGCNLVRANV